MITETSQEDPISCQDCGAEIKPTVSGVCDVCQDFRLAFTQRTGVEV